MARSRLTTPIGPSFSHRDARFLVHEPMGQRLTSVFSLDDWRRTLIMRSMNDEVLQRGDVPEFKVLCDIPQEPTLCRPRYVAIVGFTNLLDGAWMGNPRKRLVAVGDVSFRVLTGPLALRCVSTWN